MLDSADTLAIGVDGGGSGCRVAIGTVVDGICAKVEGGRANVATAPDEAIQNVLSAVKAAAREMGLSGRELKQARAHLGLAGVLTKRHRAKVVAAMPFAATEVSDDQVTAVVGALGDRDGYLVSVGTGTIVARALKGKVRAVGGWGFPLSDHASGAWLGRQALEQVLFCHDGLDKHSPLTQELLSEFGRSPHEIVSFSLDAAPGDFARLAPKVMEAARQEDLWGQAILRSGARQLIKSLQALGFAPGDRICLTGGLGPHYLEILPADMLRGLSSAKGTALDGAFDLAKSMGANHDHC